MVLATEEKVNDKSPRANSEGKCFLTVLFGFSLASFPVQISVSNFKNTSVKWLWGMDGSKQDASCTSK